MNTLIEYDLALEQRVAESAVQLDGIGVRYRIPSERVRSFKEYVIRRVKGTLTFREFWALKGVHLEVRHGETLGIVGPNGAGKSTLLKVIARVLHPTEGRVRVWGRVAPLLELGGGFHAELTGRENVFLNGALLGYSQQDIAARFDRIVEFSGLGEFIDAPLRTYSTGMVARLGFAIATDVKPDILIVDEVLSVGDMEFRKKSAERINDFRENGVTVLLVSHNLSSIPKMCERAVWLEQGEIRMIGPAAAVVNQYEGMNRG